MKLNIKEILMIIVLAGAFGIFYNIFSENSLSIIKKNNPDNIVTDSVLFGNNQNHGKEYFDKTVTYEQIIKLLEKPDVIFVDARTPEQYAKGHIGNAVNIFTDMENQEELLMKINELPPNKIYILYCDGGSCDLSPKLAEIMFDFGYEQCFLYKGGWEEWIKKQNL
jgi:rhodanese-related sulfurtransferase